jgi:lysophospholipase L1-like esterase
MQAKSLLRSVNMKSTSLWPVLRRLSMTLVAAGVLSLMGYTARAQGTGNEHWVATWGTALHEPDLGVPGLANTGFNNQTLRQIIHTSIGGRQVRVRLSTFGAGQLTVGAAHVAIRVGDAVVWSMSDRRLTFGGRPSITLPPGAQVLSDPVDLDVAPLSDLAVSIFVPGSTGPATWHFEARQTLYVSPAGDFTGSVAMPVDAAAPAGLAWFWLAGVEVLAPKQTGAIVTFGESIVDGSQSTADANNRWPDQLVRRLMARPGNQQASVINAGIAGNRLLHDSLGPNGLARFGRDVLSQAGVTHVIVQMGGNDIFTLNPAEEVTVEQIIQAHKQLIERARAKGLRVYGCTLTPVEGFVVPGTPFAVFSPAKEVKRQALNTWIRTSGAYDEVFDFDRVLRDPSQPSRILPVYDSGDHGHPNDAGYKALVDIIDLKLF